MTRGLGRRFTELVLVVALGASCSKREQPKINEAVFDVAPFRERAQVPAIAYASFTRDHVGLFGTSGAAGETNPFELASIAKLVVATAIMQAVDEKLLSLDVDVKTYVGLPTRRPVTLRMLLSHVASVRNEYEEPAEPRRLDEFLGQTFARPDAFLDPPPGEAFAYSNVGFALAAYALEHERHLPFHRCVQTTVFDRLEMASTSWPASGNAPAPTTTAPHVWKNGTFVRVARPSHAVYPASDLRGTLLDLVRFGQMILSDGLHGGRRFLSTDAVRTMLTAHYPGVAPDQGLAWQWRTIGRARVVGHEGEDRGVSTAFFLDPKAGTGAVVLANGDAFQSGDPARIAAISELLEKLLAGAQRATLP